MVTSRPATPLSTFGVTAMSESWHLPTGTASVGAALVVTAARGEAFVAVADGATDAGPDELPAPGADDESADRLAASPSPDDASLPSPSIRAIATTSSTAVPRIIRRRTQ